MSHPAVRTRENLTLEASRILDYMERTGTRVAVWIDDNGVTGGPGAFVGYEGSADPFKPHLRSAVTELIRRELLAYDGKDGRIVYYRARGAALANETITVDIAPAAWEGSELWTSFPPVKSERVRVGRHSTYRLTFEIPVARQLLDHCRLGWESSWDASTHEKHAYRNAARRLERALG